MKIGAIFPQLEFSADPAYLRDYAQTAEDLGYDFIGIYDHVVGADPEREGGWSGPYNHTHMFHEPFVLYGYFAACTKRIELSTCVIILPQRQAVLVAKQTAEVDILTEGRLRLGVGVGWNQPEHEAMGENFHTRGRRMEEQIAVMRALWTQEVVSFEGKWHKLDKVGINPLPVQRPIPLWMGGMSEAAMRRTARVADGWFPQRITMDDAGRAKIEELRGYVREAGRQPGDVGVEGRVPFNQTPDEWRQTLDFWRGVGASHTALLTMNFGIKTPEAQLEALRTFKREIGE